MSVKNIPIKILNGNNANGSSGGHAQGPPQGAQQAQAYPQGLPRYYDDNRSRSGSTFSLHRDPEARFQSPFPDDHRFPEFDDFEDLRARFRTPSFSNLNVHSPFGSMRRSPVPPSFFQQQQQQQQQPQQQARQTPPPQPATQTHSPRPPTRQSSESPKSRPVSRQSRGQCEEVERPAVIPLPPPESTSRQPSRQSSEEKQELIEKAENAPYLEKIEGADTYDSELKSPTTNSSRPRIRRKQSSVDYAAKTTVQLDAIERRVEQLRKTAIDIELEKEELLRSLNNIDLHTKMLKNADCEQEEIQAIVNRLLQRTKTVQVSLQTPRNDEQKRALENAEKAIDELEKMIESDIDYAKAKMETYINACSSEETGGATCSKFLGIIIECTAEDQKKIKRRLQNLAKNVEDAEKTTADIINDERE